MKTCPTCQATYPNDYGVCPKDSTPLQSSTEVTIGTVFRGKYQVLAKLGAGGMGSVYKVRHVHFHEVWALKLISRNLCEEPGFVERFRAEALLMRRLNHPNAVRVQDFDETEDGRLFTVMDYVEGTTLDKLVARGQRLEPERAARLVMQVCDALGAAHRLGIIHRDIKPSNIMVTAAPDGAEVAKVLDFGIAKVKEQGSLYQASLTGTGMIVGTPAYMSPEQVMGVPSEKMDGRSDLYSLGVVFFELLAGRAPFVANTPVALLMAHASTPAPDPRTLHADLPAGLVAVVLRALEKEPAERFASAEEMRDAIAAAIAPDEVAASDLPPSVEEYPSTAARYSSAEAATATRPKTPPPQVSPLRTQAPPAPSSSSPERAPARVSAPQRTQATAAGTPARRVAEAEPSRRTTATGASPAVGFSYPPAERSVSGALKAGIAVVVLLLAGGGSYMAWRHMKSGEAVEQGPASPPAIRPTPATTAPQPLPAKPESAATNEKEPAENAKKVTVPSKPAERPPAELDRSARAPKPAAAKPRAAATPVPAQPKVNPNAQEIERLMQTAGAAHVKGRYDEAIRSYQAVLALEPGNTTAQQGLERAKKAKAAEDAIMEKP
jgi:serine/threonine-protein kinase